MPEGDCEEGDTTVNFNTVEQTSDGGFIASFSLNNGWPALHNAGLLKLNADHSMNWAYLYLGDNQLQSNVCDKCSREPVVRQVTEEGVTIGYVLVGTILNNPSTGATAGCVVFVDTGGTVLFEASYPDPDDPEYQSIAFTDVRPVRDGFVLTGYRTGRANPCWTDQVNVDPLHMHIDFTGVEYPGHTAYYLTGKSITSNGLANFDDSLILHSWALGFNASPTNAGVVATSIDGTPVWSRGYSTALPPGKQAIETQWFQNEPYVAFGGPCFYAGGSATSFAVLISAGTGAVVASNHYPSDTGVNSVESLCPRAGEPGWAIAGHIQNAEGHWISVVDPWLMNDCESPLRIESAEISIKRVGFSLTPMYEDVVYKPCLTESTVELDQETCEVLQRRAAP